MIPELKVGDLVRVSTREELVREGAIPFDDENSDPLLEDTRLDLGEVSDLLYCREQSRCGGKVAKIVKVRPGMVCEHIAYLEGLGELRFSNRMLNYAQTRYPSNWSKSCQSSK
jgi:hypothetical protein